MSRPFILVGFLLSLMPSLAFGQDGPRVVKMTVSPAPPSVKPIPYPLLPHLRELKSANAAVFYERAQSLEWWGPQIRKEIDKAIETLEKPWSPEVSKKFQWLDNAGALKEIDYAARCESCDWQLLDRLRADGIWLLIPDMQSMRTIGALNAVRIRSALYRGDFDNAARALQTHFTMAKQIGEAPCLIVYLVGAALTGMGQTRIEEWIEQPDAPSLYWALTDLPQSMIDWRRPMQGESLMIEQLVPEIRQALQEDKPQPIPLHTLQKKIKRFVEVGYLQADHLEWAFHLAQLEPAARTHFTKRGLTNEELDRLPVTQLVLMFMLEEHDQRSAEYLSLQNLPYWQARPFLKKLHEARDQRRKDTRFSALQDFLMPGYESIFRVRPRIERSFALLRHIEALRLYAAQHGQWPDSLDDIRELPLPADPYTGKAFSYRREKDKAILEAFAAPGFASNENTAVRYELTLRTKKTSK